MRKTGLINARSHRTNRVPYTHDSVGKKARAQVHTHAILQRRAVVTSKCVGDGLGSQSIDNCVDICEGQYEDNCLVRIPCAAEVSFAWCREYFSTTNKST